LCVNVGFGDLRNLDDAELATCCAQLEEFEARMSTQRKELFGQIDVLSNELVRRYRSSSNVDALLDESR